MLKHRSVLAASLTLSLTPFVPAHEKQESLSHIPTPSEVLGFEVGADRKLADYKQISSYFKALAAASPRVQIEVLGKTTLGEDMFMAVISTPENLVNKAKYKDIARRLADPRGLTSQQIDQLAHDGKTILLITCNIHSTEIGSSQMSMEWAYKLATTQDPEYLRRLNDSIVLLVPSLNPDGETMVTEWYRKYIGTKYEGGPMPYLYHHYVGHDDNRDWFMLTQIETKNVNRMVYHDWFPQFWLDEHQMGDTGPRIYISPNADPVAKLVNPLVHRGNNLMGADMGWRLEEAGKSGVTKSTPSSTRRSLSKHPFHRLTSSAPSSPGIPTTPKTFSSPDTHTVPSDSSAKPLPLRSSEARAKSSCSVSAFSIARRWRARSSSFLMPSSGPARKGWMRLRSISCA